MREEKRKEILDEFTGDDAQVDDYTEFAVARAFADKYARAYRYRVIHGRFHSWQRDVDGVWTNVHEAHIARLLMDFAEEHHVHGVMPRRLVMCTATFVVAVEYLLRGLLLSDADTEQL